MQNHAVYERLDRPSEGIENNKIFVEKTGAGVIRQKIRRPCKKKEDAKAYEHFSGKFSFDTAYLYAFRQEKYR